MKRGISWLAALILCLVITLSACAEEVSTVTFEVLTVKGAADSFVSCPVFTLDGNAELSARVNSLIQQEAAVQDYISMLSQIEEGSTGLKVQYTMTDPDLPVVSIVFSAYGKMITGRPSQKYVPIVIDMETGERVTAEQVFTDLFALEELLEAYIEEMVAPLLSMHLENGELLPVPVERFALNETGITFYYENKQLSFLSGFSGAVTVPYYELEACLDVSEGSVLDRMGLVAGMLLPNEQTALRVSESAAAGHLGALPVVIGTAVEEAETAFRCTVDAGYYPKGAYLEMEDSLLRDCWILTDANVERVTGVLCRRMSLWGIRTGITCRDEWRAILGEAAFTLDMDDSIAQPYGLCAGSSDFYDYGNYTLQLHADENGILYAAVLTE